MKSVQSYLMIAALGGLSVSAHAVPLLRETRADFKTELVTIYPDSRDPNLYYFLPNKGGFARDSKGRPTFSMTTVNLNKPGPGTGGMMSFVLEAGITDAVRKELIDFKAAHPGSRLTVIPFGKSTVTLGVPAVLEGSPDAGNDALVPDPNTPAPANLQTLMKQTSGSGFGELFSSLMLPPSAGVAESQIGVNATLTKVGALLLREQIMHPSGLNLSLCFQVYGALPTFDAKVTMHYSKIYDYFAASAHGGWFWGGWSISRVVEKLHEERAIEWEIIGEDEHKVDVIRTIGEDLVNKYLVPQLTNAPGSGGYQPAGFINYGFNSTHKEEQQDMTYHYVQQKYVNDDRCIALPFEDLHDYRNQVVTDIH